MDTKYPKESMKMTRNKENTPSKDGSKVWTRCLVLSPSSSTQESPPMAGLKIRSENGEEELQEDLASSSQKALKIFYRHEFRTVCGLLCGRMPGRTNLWKLGQNPVSCYSAMLQRQATVILIHWNATVILLQCPRSETVVSMLISSPILSTSTLGPHLCL